MKKRNLKSLQLQKKSISKLDNLATKGQGRTADSDFICRVTHSACITEYILECQTEASACGC
jgi:hypothetical protein